MHASASMSLCTLVLFLQCVLVSCSLLRDLCFPQTAIAAMPTLWPSSTPGIQRAVEAFPMHTLGARCPSNVPAEPQERLGNISCILGMFGAHLVSAFVSKKCEGLFAWKHFLETLKEGCVSPAVFPSPVQSASLCRWSPKGQPACCSQSSWVCASGVWLLHPNEALPMYKMSLERALAKCRLLQAGHLHPCELRLVWCKQFTFQKQRALFMTRKAALALPCQECWKQFRNELCLLASVC